MSERCKNCGACKHCGAPAQAAPPVWPAYPLPWPWVQPWWVSGPVSPPHFTWSTPIVQMPNVTLGAGSSAQVTGVTGFTSVN